jgi:uncharacterized protein (TIGR02001 family)
LLNSIAGTPPHGANHGACGLVGAVNNFLCPTAKLPDARIYRNGFTINRQSKESKMIFTKKAASLRVLSTAVGMAVASLAAPLAAHAEDAPASPFTGNINVVSKYVLRGITTTGGSGIGTENNNTAVQGGFDYAHSSGIYAGYWGSNLGYTTNTTTGGADTYNNGSLGTGFENDFYAGYKGKAGSFSYGLGLIYYAYTGVAYSDGAELALTAGLGNATLGINYLLQDLAWGNQGDTYINLGYTQALPSDFSLAANLLYYFYTKEGKYINAAGTNTDALGSGFRGVSATLSHPLGKTGATMGLTVVGGGEDRNGVYQKWMPVLSVGMTF